MTQLSRRPDNLITLAPPRSHTLLSDLRTLTKTRITVMVALTTYLGYAIAIAIEGVAMPWWNLAGALIGASLSCMGASALNQYCEIDSDRLMDRTADRPLPAGRLSQAFAMKLGIVLSLAGVATLALLAGQLAAVLSAFTILSYVFIYTPMKKVSSVSTIVGAVPGALPPIIGYAAVTSSLSPLILSLFAIMFLWQLPHFLAIAWLYREDYARGGFPMLSVLDPTGQTTFRHILLTTIALLPLSLLPVVLGDVGIAYFLGTLAAGLVLLLLGIRLHASKANAHARLLFFATLVYLPFVLVLALIDLQT